MASVERDLYDLFDRNVEVATDCGYVIESDGAIVVECYGYVRSEADFAHKPFDRLVACV